VLGGGGGGERGPESMIRRHLDSMLTARRWEEARGTGVGRERGEIVSMNMPAAKGSIRERGGLKGTDTHTQRDRQGCRREGCLEGESHVDSLLPATSMDGILQSIHRKLSASHSLLMVSQRIYREFCRVLNNNVHRLAGGGEDHDRSRDLSPGASPGSAARPRVWRWRRVL
jgi:hypothetical protein